MFSTSTKTIKIAQKKHKNRPKSRNYVSHFDAKSHYILIYLRYIPTFIENNF